MQQLVIFGVVVVCLSSYILAQSVKLILYYKTNEQTLIKDFLALLQAVALLIKKERCGLPSQVWEKLDQNIKIIIMHWLSIYYVEEFGNISLCSSIIVQSDLKFSFLVPAA